MDQWTQIHENFDQWTAPLRPSPEDVAMYQDEIPPGARVLLLGITPELLPLAQIAVDHNPRAIEMHRGRALLADWRCLPFEDEFDVVIGDGCLNVFQGETTHFFRQAAKALKRGGRLILRVFTAPEQKETLEEVFRKKEGMGFHAFKWRVAHALADPWIHVQEIERAVRPVWNHPTLDMYRGSDLVYYFPRLSELPRPDRVQFGHSYELADRCPVLTWNSFTNSSNFPGGNASR